MVLLRNHWQTQQKLDVFLFGRVLIVELEPIVEILVDLIIWFTRDEPLHVALMSLLKNGVGLLKISLRDVLDIEFFKEGLLLLNKFFEILLSQSLEIIWDG